MANPLWGELEKAQDDSTTIVQYIAAQIAAHNADSEAHLAAGESLNSHKDEDVIDHPAGSVVADKATMTELAVYTVFESLIGWSELGTVDNDEALGASLYIESGFEESSGLSSSINALPGYRTNTKDMLFQAVVTIDVDPADYNAHWGFYSGTLATPTGFGFRVIDGVLTAYVKSGATVNESSTLTCDLSAGHIFRAFLDASESEIYFYIDGTLVATLDVPALDWDDDGGPSLKIENADSTDGYMYIGSLYFTRQI